MDPLIYNNYYTSPLIYNDYYIALIIITIITIAISLALSFYFIFIPSARIETEFDELESRGLQTIQNLNRLVTTSTNISDEILKDTCESIIYTADKLFGIPQSEVVPKKGCIVPLYCITCNPFVPSVCDPFKPQDPGCTCT